MFNGIVYRTINLANGKWFIGLDEHNDPKYLGDGALLRRDIKRYGRKKFRKETLCVADSLEELVALEHKLIQDYDAYRNPASYNVDLVGDDGVAVTGFTKLAQAEQAVKRSTQWRMLSPERQQKIKQAVSSAHKGKAKSASQRELISKALKGKRKPKTSSALKQYWKGNSEARAHLSSVCGRAGEQNGFYGQQHSAETRAKISASVRGKARKKALSAEDVAVIRRRVSEGVKQSELAQLYGVSKPTISRCLRQPVG